jgi:ParB family chromosome partitioning protein
MRLESTGRQVLGRGLAALLGSESGPISPESKAEILHISLDKVIPNPYQPRTVFDAVALQELAHSIREHGVLQPLLVRHLGDQRYELIAGERRLRASKLAGLKEVPCCVMTMEAQKQLEVALLENIQRDDLNPIEEAKGYQNLMGAFEYTQEQLAQRLGKSRSHIANLLRIVNLPVEVQELILEGRLTLGHAKILAGVSDPLACARVMVEQKMSVRDAEEWLKREGKKDIRVIKRSEHASQEELLLQEQLHQMIGCDVVVKAGEKGGAIKLTFLSLGQMEDFIEKIQETFKKEGDL